MGSNPTLSAIFGTIINTILRTKADIKGMVAGDRKVRFTHFRQGELWYVTA